MADNYTAKDANGTAQTFAADDVGSAYYPRVKMIWGADGAVNDTSAAAPLPVVQTGTPALPTGASTAAKQPALGTAGTASADVITVQGIASMTALKVDGSAVTQPVSGTFWQATQPVSGTVTANLAAGTNNIGDVDVLTLPALAAGTNNIGDVDIASIAAGDNNIGNVDIASALPAGTNNIGDVDIASIAAGDNNIGNVDIASAIPAGTNLIGRVSSSDETSTIYNGTTALTPKFVIIDAATSGDNTILAAVNPKKIRVHSLFLIASAAVTVRFESGAGGTALTGQMQLGANGGFVLPYNPVGWFETASNTLLNLELSGAVSVDGSLQYTEV